MYKPEHSERGWKQIKATWKISKDKQFPVFYTRSSEYFAESMFRDDINVSDLLHVINCFIQRLFSVDKLYLQSEANALFFS